MRSMANSSIHSELLPFLGQLQACPNQKKALKYTCFKIVIDNLYQNIKIPFENFNLSGATFFRHLLLTPILFLPFLSHGEHNPPVGSGFTNPISTPGLHQDMYKASGDDFVARVSACTDPTAVIVAKPFICDGEDVELTFNFSGGGPYTLILSFDGSEQSPLTTTDENFSLIISGTTIKDSVK